MIFRDVIFFTVAIFLCSSVGAWEEPHYSKLAKRVLGDHIREMRHDGFSATMTGGGMREDIDLICVGFESDFTSDIENARIQYVLGVERLLARMNEDQAVRPFLHNYPFAVGNLEYLMSFKETPMDASGQFPIVFVSTSHGKIYYCVHDAAYEHMNPLREVFTEPYEEALCIVKEAGGLNPLFDASLEWDSVLLTPLRNLWSSIVGMLNK